MFRDGIGPFWVHAEGHTLHRSVPGRPARESTVLKFGGRERYPDLDLGDRNLFQSLGFNYTPTCALWVTGCTVTATGSRSKLNWMFCHQVVGSRGISI